MRIDTHVTGIADVERLLGQVAPRHAKNIMRTTVHDMAKELRDESRENMPVDEGVMVKETKHKRERGTPTKMESTVRVGNKAFYWRFLEYGDGPDGVAYDMFLKAVVAFRGHAMRQFLTSFVKKFEAAAERSGRSAKR